MKTAAAGMTRRLAEFRSLNEEDTTVLNYFDEKEIHPEHISEPSLSLFLYFITIPCRY